MYRVTNSMDFMRDFQHRVQKEISNALSTAVSSIEKKWTRINLVLGGTACKYFWLALAELYVAAVQPGNY